MDEMPYTVVDICIVLEVTAASSFRRKDIKNGGSMFLLDDGNFLPDCISHRRFHSW